MSLLHLNTMSQMPQISLFRMRAASDMLLAFSTRGMKRVKNSPLQSSRGSSTLHASIILGTALDT